MRERLVLVEDRGPLQAAERPVDRSHQLVDPGLHPLVVLDPGARRDDDHQQHHPAPPIGVGLQEGLVGQQPVGDPLGVVEPVDRQDRLPPADRPTQLVALAGDLRLGPPGREGLKLDPHREGLDPGQPVRKHYPSHLVVIAEDAADALEEVLGVVVGMEPDEVSPEHPL